MAERIDELQLLIGSDASSAIRQLGNLAGALDSAAASARKLSSATGFASHFVDSLNRLSHVNLDRTLSNLERLSKLDLSNLKDKTVTISLKVMGADETERAKYAAQDAAKEIAKNSMQIAKSLGQKYNVDVSGIKQLSEALKEMAQSFADGGNGADAQKRMFSIISERGKESEAAIMGVEQRYKEFADYVNNMKFTATCITSAAERENALSGGMLRNLKNDAAGLDQVWTELIGKFPDLFNSVEQAAANPSDQLDILTQKIQTVRALLKKHEIVDDNTFDNIGASVLKTATDSFDKFNQSKDKFMRESMDRIPIDLDIDQNRFESQIQQAITKATSKTYKTQPIKLELDNQSLRDSVESAFSLIDIAKLPQFAAGFTQVSQAISTMNQVNFKDSGIDKFTASLRRLISTDTSKFDVATFRGIADAIKDLASIGNVNKALNSFVSSIARLANAGDKTEKTALGMKKLVPELKDAVTVFSQLGAIDATITSFVASLARLATAGDKSEKTADGLGKLSQAVMQFINALSKAPAIDANIANTIQGLGNLASAGTNAGRAMNSVLGGGGSSGGIGKGLASTAASTAIRTLSNSFKTLLSAAVKLGGQGASALGNFLAKMHLIPSQATSIDRTALSFTNLLRAIIPFYGIRGIFQWGKEALESGSAIVELENVIDTSFGNLKKGYEDISGYIYKWAQTTIDAFGVSQIAAERYAGRLMAMFNSSGFDVTERMRDSAAKMTTDLIERAGDVASFYDITVDEAMTKFQSGLAGMTRPLRSLGINMSVANMQSFALSQGITTAWKEMDQASQMALRYQYILNATQYAAGDFQKTQLSLANQCRLLTLNFQVLSTTIGQGLVSAIAPVIAWLNLLIKRLIQAATAFRTFMWTLFGKPLQAARGTSDDMAGYLDDATGAASGLADGAGGAADNLGSAGKAAKNLKKQLQVLPFDELNQLAKDTESAGSGGGGGAGGGGGGGLGDLGGLLDGMDTSFDLSGSKTLSAINEWARQIKMAFNQHDWGKLGSVVADGINTGLKKLYDLLDWDKWKDKIYGFIQPFHSTMNTIVAKIDWDLLGRTLSRGLNMLTRTFRMWINGFNWKQWGTKLAEGMNGMLDELDADALGRAIADKFRAAWNFFGGWVKKFDFKLFGKKLKDGILGAIDEIDWGDIGDSLGELFNGINETIIEFLEDGQVANEIGEAFSTLVNNFISTFDEGKAQRAMQTVKTQIGKALGKAIRDIDKQALAEDFKTLLGELPWDVISTAIGVSVGAKLAAGIFGTAFKAAAFKAIMSVGSGATIGVGGAGAGAGAAGTGAGAGIAGAAGGLAGAGGILAALTLAVKGIESVSELYKHSKGETSMGDIRRRNGNKPLLSNDYGADILNNVPATPSKPQAPSTESSTSAKTTILKAMLDPSFKSALEQKRKLETDGKSTSTVNGKETNGFRTTFLDYIGLKDDKATKTANGKFTNGYKVVQDDYKHFLSETIVKHTNAQKTNAYNGIREEYRKWVGDTITKMTNAQKTKAYNTVNSDFVHWISNTATKTANSDTTASYDKIKGDWDGFSDKWITAHIKADMSNFIKKIDAYNGSGDFINTILRTKVEYYAKGGLFTNAAVFGEAGDEAAIPLERKSTMRKIANAIVDSGGTMNSSDAVAEAIARRMIPAIAGMIEGSNNRPVQVNATLYTENDEVLARAVTRGQKSIDKRYNPVSQFSY